MIELHCKGHFFTLCFLHIGHYTLKGKYQQNIKRLVTFFRKCLRARPNVKWCRGVMPLMIPNIQTNNFFISAVLNIEEQRWLKIHSFLIRTMFFNHRVNEAKNEIVFNWKCFKMYGFQVKSFKFIHIKMNMNICVYIGEKYWIMMIICNQYC